MNWGGAKVGKASEYGDIQNRTCWNAATRAIRPLEESGAGTGGGANSKSGLVGKMNGQTRSIFRIS